MQTLKNQAVLAIGGMAIVAFAACSAEGPSGPTPMTQTGSDFQQLGGSGLQVDEDFNCGNTTGARARFDAPGFVEFNAVGYYVRFEGVEDTNVELRVAWDYNGDPSATEQYQVIELNDQDVTRVDETLTIEKVIEHTYDVRTVTKKRARVELMLADQVGNCAKVRDVTVAPPVTTCTVTTGTSPLRSAGASSLIPSLSPGEFVFGVAPGTPLPEGAVPISIRANPVAMTTASDWKLTYGIRGGTKMHYFNGYVKGNAAVTGGSCTLGS